MSHPVPALAAPQRHRALAIATSALAMLAAASPVFAGGPPPIRSSDSNRVPACATPEHLMAFIAERNPQLDPRFKDIATFYKRFGEQWHVRWDYAVFQMILETNYLSYRRGNGRRGDVWEDQNNFAGIGATGRGARGERFGDVETGVHAQIQHLVAYSGETVDEPVARRTRENQDDIIRLSKRLGRDVTFGDLARRWATDRHYATSIEFVADLYRVKYCTGRQEAADASLPPDPKPLVPIKLPFPPPSGLGGPKPAKLAGPDPAPEAPEILPWQSTTEDSAPASSGIEQSAPAEPPTHSKSRAPKTSQDTSRFKTIWSRGAAPKKFDPGPVPAPVNGGALLKDEDGPPVGDGPPLGDGQDVGLSADAPLLPTFHIAPVAAAPSKLGGPPPQDLIAPPTTTNPKCHILTASYGGSKIVLLRAVSGDETNLTVLTVLEGFEKSMVQNYAKSNGAPVQLVGEYPDSGAAFAAARDECNGG